MTSIGEVWDSTVDVARGRAGVIAPVALAAFAAPSIVLNAVGAFGEADAASTSLLWMAAVVGLIVLFVWGRLAITAIATDPATTRAMAIDVAGKRLKAGLGVTLLVAMLSTVAALPIVVGLAMSGIDFPMIARATQAGQRVPDAAFASAARGTLMFVAIYAVMFAALAAWFAARVLPYIAVVLHERHGMRAIPRAFALTRGLTWKLIAVVILYAVAALLLTQLSQTIVFIPARLLLGEDHAAAALFLASIVSALLGALLGSVFSIFIARLYVATAGVPSMRKDSAPAA